MRSGNPTAPYHQAHVDGFVLVTDAIGALDWQNLLRAASVKSGPE
jgi:hypothetical protein